MAYERLIYTNADGESVEFSPHSTYWTNFKKDVTGFSDVSASLTTIDMIGENGSNWVKSKVKEKNITITGTVYISGKSNIAIARRNLNHILNPQVSGTLTYVFNGFRRSIECHPVTAPAYTDGTIYPKYSIDLTCTDPFWHDSSDTTISVVAYKPLWYWTLDSTYIIEDSFFFGSRDETGYIDVLNSGDDEVGQILTITSGSTVSGIKILNIDTNEYIQYDGSIENGDVLEIDTRRGKKTVTLTRNNVKIDVFSNINYNSTFIQLAIGSNRLKVSIEGTGDDRDLEVYSTFYPAYLGV